jgi:hypothetical protein
MSVQEEIERATVFGQSLEDIIVKKGSFTLGELADRERLLLAYWSLATDLDKSILALMRKKFYGGAFALLRPLVEAQTRAHIVLMGDDDTVTRIKEDKYTLNFKAVGAETDAAFNLEGFFDTFLNGARGALHSFTHSGLSQLSRRFKGNYLEADYGDEEIVEVIRTSSSATWMVTNLVVKHFNLKEESKIVEDLFLQHGKR